MSDQLSDEPVVVDAVARCLAVQDGTFIDAAIWEREQQPVYRARARRVLDTIDNARGGNHTGGLPPTLEATMGNLPKGEKTISEHFTKAQAETACSRRLVEAPKEGKSSGHARVRYKVRPTGKKWGKRWQVVSL